MTRDEIIETLRKNVDEIRRRHGVVHLALFGSVSRDDGRPDSDVDILMEFGSTVSIFKFLALKEYLEGILGRPLDLVMRKALRPQLRDRILAEAISAT